MRKEVTLTREQFREVASRAITNGDLMTKAIEKDVHRAFTLMLMSVPIVTELEEAFFGKEEDN